MTYQETLDWMFVQLPMYQNQGKTAYKKDITNIVVLSKELGNPERDFKTIHVGGTNGKGSTSHMIASVLQEAGYKVGLYTSPHLKTFTERIRINGKEIPEQNVIDFISINKSYFKKEQLSFFEMTVGMAFDYFSNEKVDIAIIEVGLGGRLDSTNIINPEVSVITNIGLDHTQFLGNTLPEIASEKAGIIKNNVPAVIGERQKEVEAVFKAKTDACNSKIIFASDKKEDYQTDLLGDYQQKNIQTSITAIRQLNDFEVSEENIKEGLLNVVKNTNLKGRWQVLQENPKVICDTAHNKEGLHYTLKQLEKECYKTLHIVLGMVSDKNIDEILPMFPVNASYYFCKPGIPRGLSEEVLKKSASKFGLKGQSFDSVNQAFESILQNSSKEDVVYVGGSTFVVAEIL